ncbi:hypothetical protein ABZ920_23015 [Streptomyces sp. NPDC046831]|uniref:hypothetical protein n=1 Tax=Streptomyces sp. NPDC046831 TaxID=3154805 RepID=UPI0033CC3C73
MSTAPHVRRTARRGGCVRVLVLLLALFLPGAHTAGFTAPVPAVSGQAGGTAAEQDHLDAALRPPVRNAERAPVLPLRPVPRPVPPATPAVGRGVAAPPHPSPLLRALRSVVLRC